MVPRDSAESLGSHFFHKSAAACYFWRTASFISTAEPVPSFMGILLLGIHRVRRLSAEYAPQTGEWHPFGMNLARAKRKR